MLATYYVSVLDLILSVFRASDNLIVFIPFVALCIGTLFSIFWYLIRK